MSIKYIYIIFIYFFTLQVFAAPPLRRIQKSRQSDGSLIKTIKNGDENFSYYSTLDGTPVIKDEKGDFCYAHILSKGIITNTKQLAHNKSLRTISELSSAQLSLLTLDNIKDYKTRITTNSELNTPCVPSKGAPVIPIILVEYQDVAFKKFNSINDFNEHFNSENYTDYGSVGSVRQYFIDQSDSLFSPSFEIIGPIKLSKVRSYYGSNRSNSDIDTNGRSMILEAIRLAKENGTDFSQFANSNNHVPLVGVIYAGEGEQSSNASNCEDFIWAKFDRLYGVSESGVSIGSYLCTSELFVKDINTETNDTIFQRDGIGVFCHEFTHALGLPDFYDTGTQGNFGMDMWSIMDYGEYFNDGYCPTGYTCYEREFLNWITIPELTEESSSKILTPISKRLNTRTYKIINDENKNEYYILENRQPSRWFDAKMGSGMLVIHVDFDAYKWNNNIVNQIKTHQRMFPIPADNNLKSIANNGTYEDYKGDLYPGTTNNQELSDESTPAAKIFTSQTFMGKPIYNIREKDGNIYFSYLTKDQASNINNQQLTNHHLIKVYDLAGHFIQKGKNIEELRKTLPIGLYLFQQDGKTKKIIIK